MMTISRLPNPKSNQIAIVKSTLKCGFRVLYVWEVRSDGWVRGHYNEREIRNHGGGWIAPHNVVSFHKISPGWDYNGIENGTLVNLDEEVGLVISREGPWYIVMVSGEKKKVSWENLVPVEKID